MRRRKTAFILFLTLLGHWGLWLAYTNNVGWREMIAGALAAAICTLAAAVFARNGGAQFDFRPRDLLQGIHLPREILEGTWQLFKALAIELFTAQGATSTIAKTPFAVGGDDPQSAGRRALALTFTTITPNSVVLGFSRQQKLMLSHQILPAEPSITLKRLGARP